MRALNNCNMSLINVNNDYYAFDFINYEILKINENERFIFESIMKQKKFPEDEKYKKDILKIILKIKSGLFFTENKIELYKGEDKGYDAIISFPIMHKCNLKCKYCFAKAGEVYEGENKIINNQVIDQIFFFLDTINNNISNIRLEFVGGGETFLDKNLYKDTMNYINKVVSTKSIALKTFTLTNGTTLDKDIVSYAKNNNISLGISLDGPKNIQDFHRPFQNGENSYDKVIENIEKSFSKGNKNIWIVSVITSYTESLIDILNHNKILGSKSMEMRIMRGKDNYNLSVSEENLIHFKDLYSDLANYLKNNLDDIMLILNDYDTFGKIIKRLLVKEKIIYRCQAGKTKFSFTADGDVYPCDSFVGHPNYKIGNIFTKEFNKELLNEFNDNSVFNNIKCKNCEFKFLCGGDCYYNSYINKDDKTYCALQKHICKLGIDLIYYIKENNYDQYIKLQKFAKVRYMFN